MLAKGQPPTDGDEEESKTPPLECELSPALWKRQKQQPRQQQLAVVDADDDLEEEDLFDEAESLSSDSSAKSRVWESEHENGRTYHSVSAGKYQYPNDQWENDRLNFQHLIWTLTLEGKLAVCPAHQTAKRVLDMGTGTGVWAIAFANEFKDAEVIGVDLSPIQPSWAPPNCKFEIDDLEKPWAWHEPFDFIFCRTMEGSFADPKLIIQEIYEYDFSKLFSKTAEYGLFTKTFGSNLAPGGWFEAGGFVLPMGCDDGSVPEESALRRWHDLMAQAGEQCGRSIESPSKYTKAIEDAGFVDIVTEKFIWPLNTWPKDKRFKEIGRWMVLNLDMGIEALTLGLLTRVMGWTREEVLKLCDDVRKDLAKTWYHAYWNVHVVYARKPLQIADDEESQGEASSSPPLESAESPEPSKTPGSPKSPESPKSSGSSHSPPRKRQKGRQVSPDP